MPFKKNAAISALSVMAAAAPAAAQQFISAPGITIIVAPGQAQPMPDAFQVMNAQMAQMNAVMQQMDAQMAAMSEMAASPAAFANAPAGVSGIAITTFSDGSKSCTERVLYPAPGAAQKVQVSETGNDCAALQPSPSAAPIPSALPAAPVRPKAPATIVVDNARDQKPMMLADRD